MEHARTSVPPASRGARRAAAAVATLLLLGACSSSRPHTAAGSTTAAPAPAASATTTTATATATGSGVDALQSAFQSVVSSVTPSVVEISTDQGLGSGIIYDKAGHIVTNAHVVGTSTQFQVTLGDGRTLAGTLVGTYPPDDLAVIAVPSANLPKAPPFADSTKTSVGALCLAIGNPLGLASSVTFGIVSFNGRTVDEGNGVVLPSTIQTSAPINPGNSGGALVDLKGEVIGIPTLAATDPQLGGSAAPGIGFAISSNTVKLIADQLVQSGKVTHSGRAALGILGTEVATPNGSVQGVLVRRVDPGSAAANAGIVAGDVITKIDSTPTPDLGALSDVLANHQPGDNVQVQLTRPDGTTKTVTATLGELTA